MKALKTLFNLGLIIAGLGVMSYFVWFQPPAVNPDPNHTHADFAVWINGEKLDFSGEEFMSEVPTAGDHADEEEHEHIPGREYLHLHDGRGDVIHRHKPGLTVGDFFASIGYTLTPTCFEKNGESLICSSNGTRLRMFVNDEEMLVDPAYAFADMDKILITYGSTDEEIEEQLDELTNDACLYSQTCPERGTPPEENCIADPAVPCVIQ